MKNNKKKMKAKTFAFIMSGAVLVTVSFGIVFTLLTTTYFDPVLRDFFGEQASATGSLSGSDDVIYDKMDFSTVKELEDYETSLVREIGGEGYVLLKNDTANGKGLPIATDKNNKTKLSLFSHSSVDIVAGGTGSGVGTSNLTLKDALENNNYDVNDTLWNFYATGNGKGYKRGSGSINYGQGEDWSINECPLSKLQGESGLLASTDNSTAVYVLSRTGGEGRDLGRSMTNFTSIAADKSKSYLEPDSVELGVISYLNDNFDNVILLVNTNNVMELGWVEDYENINSVLWVPGGGGEAANSIADVIVGNVTPSGHLTDTMAYDAFSSPAMKNMGDFQYTVSGSSTGYYGVSYDEGIYVGYKYYETRYYDSVMNQGNVGDYDYSTSVQYPFGYGLSYTTFDWTNYKSSSMDKDGNIEISVDIKNTGSVKGKEVVQVYLESPYTDYDRENHIEKSAVSLVGYAKTSLLEPGSSETVKVTVSRDDFVSYDDTKAKTYILDQGDYNLTAASDAHKAANNILAKHDKVMGGKMDENGNKDFVSTWTNSNLDTSTYSKSEKGTEVTNRFDGDNLEGSNYINRDKYLSRNDWTNTFPVTHGNQNRKVKSTYGEVNGYSYQEEITSDLKKKLDLKGTSEAAKTPLSDEDAASKAGEMGKDGDLELIDYRGKAYDDKDYEELASQVTTKEAGKIINLAGYTSEKASSIQKPKAIDLDGPMGLNNMATHEPYSISYPSEVTIAPSFNDTLSEKHGNAVANDGLKTTVKASGWYAPAMNIHRTPFAGRNFEYYSEDSYMSGKMAIAATTGAAKKGMYSFVKHFALNDQEDHRSDNGLVTWCNEQAMREIYLQPFQMVAEAKPVTMSYYEKDNGGNLRAKTTEMPLLRAVMSSFNRIGYTWAGGDYRLITEVLRNEWGFNGFVLTDYSLGATSYMHTEQMLRAGGDGQLTQYGNSYAITNDTQVYYSKQALKHILFTVVNSNAMNGFKNGTVVADTPFANYYYIVISVDILLLLAVGGFVTLTVLRFKKDKQGKEIAKETSDI